MKRANHLPAPHFFNLNQACKMIDEAFPFGLGTYLVGSSLETRDYRDVDVRCILHDEDFCRIFGATGENPQFNALWSIMCATISLWLSKHTDLPVDFQIQRMSKANEQYPFKRSALGMFVHESTPPTEEEKPFNVPCPHEGDEEACSRCWASHDDAVPYCSADEYKLEKERQVPTPPTEEVKSDENTASE